jgi:hypothetical protein
MACRSTPTPRRPGSTVGKTRHFRSTLIEHRGEVVGVIRSDLHPVVHAAVTTAQLGAAEVVHDTGLLTDRNGRRGRFVLTWHADPATPSEATGADGDVSG